MTQTAAVQYNNAQAISPAVLAAGPGVANLVAPVANGDPKNCIDWATLTPLIIASIDASKMEAREKSNGPYATTTQHSKRVRTADGGEYQISLSVNYKPQGTGSLDKDEAEILEMAQQILTQKGGRSGGRMAEKLATLRARRG